MTTKWMTVTPAQAIEWLEIHDKLEAPQRRLYWAKVGQYASDMKAGRWTDTHQGIGLAKNGAIMDGLHRLHAVAKSGVSTGMLVSQGLPQDALDSIDTGRPRSVSMILQMSHGIQKAGAVTASIRAILTIGNHRLTNVVSAPQMLKMYAMIGNELVDTMNLLGMVKPQGYLAGPIAFYMSVKPRKAKDFAESYRDLADLPKGHAVLHLKKGVEIMRRRHHEIFNLTQQVCEALHRYEEGIVVPDPLVPIESEWDWLISMNPDLMKKLLKVID